MKLFCRIYGKPAYIVGYVQGRRKVRAIVILGGELKTVPLAKIELETENFHNSCNKITDFGDNMFSFSTEPPNASN